MWSRCLRWVWVEQGSRRARSLLEQAASIAASGPRPAPYPAAVSQPASIAINLPTHCKCVPPGRSRASWCAPAAAAGAVQGTRQLLHFSTHCKLGSPGSCSASNSQASALHAGWAHQEHSAAQRAVGPHRMVRRAAACGSAARVAPVSKTCCWPAGLQTHYATWPAATANRNTPPGLSAHL